MKLIESICVFGDSTAWGAWDMEKGGWVNRLWLFVGNRDQNYKEIYNLSISGGTTKTILERFESEARQRNADAIIFQTGGNDCSFKYPKGDNLIPLKIFIENLEKIIIKARAITENILFVGFKNCDESKTVPVSWIDICYTNENIKKYNEAMKDVCLKNNVLFLDDIGILENDDFEDGLHPNAKGHEKMFQLVRDFLIEYKWI